MADILDQQIRIETSVEIIAKKMWHRGSSFRSGLPHAQKYNASHARHGKFAALRPTRVTVQPD
jgi:hypothetical protein